MLKEQRALKRSLRGVTVTSTGPYIRETKPIPSLGDGIGNGVKKDVLMYTGDKLLGIGTLHKSNAIPIFKQEEAKDLASMRR